MKIKIIIALPVSIFYHTKLFILTFEEFNNKFGIDNKAKSNIRIEDIGKDITLTQIEIVMRDLKADNASELNFKIIVILHPTYGTHWVLVIGREGGSVYYFDRFGVETPPLFLEEYVYLGSNERIQHHDESYCAAYCLYMIYLIDIGFELKSASNILATHVKCPGMYNEHCFCLGCKYLAFHEQSPFAVFKDNTNDNINVNYNVKVNDNVNVYDNVNDNIKVNDNVNVNVSQSS